MNSAYIFPGFYGELWAYVRLCVARMRYSPMDASLISSHTQAEYQESARAQRRQVSRDQQRQIARTMSHNLVV